MGDSFTEGLDDPSTAVPGRCRGWADRLAEEFATLDARTTYANLAIRGRKLGAIIGEQLPQALELRPELVSLAGGTNDVLRPSVDLDALAASLEDAVHALRANGSQVLLFQSVAPWSGSRLLGRALPRISALTTIVEEVAERYECVLVRLWGAPVFQHPAAWSEDRLHLSAEGHARVTGAALEALGLGDHHWAAAMGVQERQAWRIRTAQDAQWARRHLAPWVGRRLRGVSSGDRISAKRPELRPARDLLHPGTG